MTTSPCRSSPDFPGLFLQQGNRRSLTGWIFDAMKWFFRHQTTPVLSFLRRMKVSGRHVKMSAFRVNRRLSSHFNELRVRLLFSGRLAARARHSVPRSCAPVVCAITLCSRPMRGKRAEKKGCRCAVLWCRVRDLNPRPSVYKTESHLLRQFPLPSAGQQKTKQNSQNNGLIIRYVTTLSACLRAKCPVNVRFSDLRTAVWVGD